MFDGDAAGQAAALKAFDGEQKVAGQSFVAVAADGMDPCDLRLKSGDGALRDLVARRIPMFEFAIRSRVSAEHDLDNAEGRVDALRRCVPLVARIKDYDAARRVRPPAGRLGRLGRRRPGAQPGARGGAASAACPTGARRASRAAAGPSRDGRAARGCPPRPARPDAVAAARGAQVGAAVPGDRRAGVRLADRRELHPSRVRGGARGHRGGRRHVGRAVRRAVDRGRPRAGRPRRAAASLVNELGVEPSRSRTTRSCRATSAACWPGCRRCGSAARSPR